MDFDFAGLAIDMDFDGFQTVVLHAEMKLFVNFLWTVLLETITHARASARVVGIAMQFAG